MDPTRRPAHLKEKTRWAEVSSAGAQQPFSPQKDDVRCGIEFSKKKKKNRLLAPWAYFFESYWNCEVSPGQTGGLNQALCQATSKAVLQVLRHRYSSSHRILMLSFVSYVLFPVCRCFFRERFYFVNFALKRQFAKLKRPWKGSVMVGISTLRCQSTFGFWEGRDIYWNQDKKKSLHYTDLYEIIDLEIRSWTSFVPQNTKVIAFLPEGCTAPFFASASSENGVFPTHRVSLWFCCAVMNHWNNVDKQIHGVS